MGEGDYRGMGLPADGVSVFSIGIARYWPEKAVLVLHTTAGGLN